MAISLRVRREHLEIGLVGVDAIPAFARDLVQDARRLQRVDSLHRRRLADREQLDLGGLVSTPLPRHGASQEIVTNASRK